MILSCHTGAMSDEMDPVRGNERIVSTAARGRARRAALIAACLLLSACSSNSDLFGSPSAAPGASASGSFRERMSAMLGGGSPAPAPASAAGTAGADIDCPPVEVRQGTSTLSAAPAGQEPTATNLRYQVSIGQTARECAILGATLTIKVGVQGRVVLGPAGSPGPIEIPVRLALVREGIEPKTVWTKLYRVPLTIQPGQTNIPFLHIEEDLTVPVPGGADLDAYVVYVGFDPLAAKEPRKPARKPKQ